MTVSQENEGSRNAFIVPVLLIVLTIVPFLGGLVRLQDLLSGAEITPENIRFVKSPTPVVLHIISSLLFCILGAFQFPAIVRKRRPNWHRMSGRLLMPIGFIAAVTGVWMTLTYDIPTLMQGTLLYWVRLMVGVAMALFICRSFIAIRAKNISTHRAYIIRAYALGQGAATQVLLLLPLLLTIGEITGLFRDIVMSFAWVINIVIAERIISNR